MVFARSGTPSHHIMNITIKTWLSAIAGLILGPTITFGALLMLAMSASDALESPLASRLLANETDGTFSSAVLIFAVILPISALLGALTGAYFCRKGWSDSLRRILSVSFGIIAMLAAFVLGVCASLIIDSNVFPFSIWSAPDANFSSRAMMGLVVWSPTAWAVALSLWCALNLFKPKQK